MTKWKKDSQFAGMFLNALLISLTIIHQSPWQLLLQLHQILPDNGINLFFIDFEIYCLRELKEQEDSCMFCISYCLNIAVFIICMAFTESICHIHTIIRNLILLLIELMKHFIFFLIYMFLGFIQKISVFSRKEYWILHAFVVETNWNQERIPKKIKYAVVADCHHKCRKIFIFISIK